ncbi:MAG: DUF192 domain-containing protein [Chloroflexi bacterium]|nr:DUF192 domain-containing protein [Chloroflexota bacterium]
MNWRLSFAALIGLAALAVLACGPSGDPATRGGVIAPAVERPEDLAGLLDLPSLVGEVVFPWSEVAVRRPSGEITVGVLVANTSDRRSRGMMYWSGLPPNSGMIFIWEETRARSGGFWNQNVPIDLSVAWLDRDGTILEFSTLLAEDETSKRPRQPYFFVLEMPYGRFETMGIDIGDRVIIPETLLPNQ